MGFHNYLVLFQAFMSLSVTRPKLEENASISFRKFHHKKKDVNRVLSSINYQSIISLCSSHKRLCRSLLLCVFICMISNSLFLAGY